MKICLTCGQSFIDPKHPDRKYCSLACSTTAQKRRETVNCPHCGKEFEKRVSRNNRYCSLECAYADRKPTKREIRACGQCGKEFETWSYRDTKFCSRECAWKASNKPETHLIRHCEVCGKEYAVQQFFVLNRVSRYCSRNCLDAANSVNKRGALNINYRGGTVLYRGANWGRQSRLAAVRDGYKCQCCGKNIRKRKGDYGVHHITPYRTFNGDWERANQLNNLITLCRRCHGKVEAGKLACPQPLF